MVFPCCALDGGLGTCGAVSGVRAAVPRPASRRRTCPAGSGAQRGSAAPSSSCRQICAATGVSRMPCRKKPVAMISPGDVPVCGRRPGLQPGPAVGRCPASRAVARAVASSSSSSATAGSSCWASRSSWYTPPAETASGTGRRRFRKGVFALGGPDHHGAVLARDDVYRHAADQAAHGGGSSGRSWAGTRSRRMSPWTGRSGRRQSRREAAEPGRTQAVGHDGLPGADLPAAGQADAGGRARRRQSSPAARRCTARLAAVRGQQRGDPGEQRAGDPPDGRRGCRRRRKCAGLSRGSRSACLPDGQWLHRKSAGLLHGPEVRERPAVGRVGADREGRRREGSRSRRRRRPLRRSAECRLRAPAGAAPRSGPQPRGLEHQLQQVLLLVVEFAHRGEHAGRRPAGAGAGGVVDQGHGPARAAAAPTQCRARPPRRRSRQRRNIARRPRQRAAARASLKPAGVPMADSFPTPVLTGSGQAVGSDALSALQCRTPVGAGVCSGLPRYGPSLEELGLGYEPR